MIGYTDEQNYKDIADAIRDLTGDTSKTFTPSEMSDYINNIDKNEFGKFKIPVIVFSNISNYDITKGTQTIYSSDLTSTTYNSSTIPSNTPKLLYTGYKEPYTQQAWEWDADNATVDNPEVFKKSSRPNVSNPIAYPLVAKHKLKGHVEIFAGNLPNGHHLSQDLEFNDSDKESLILPTEKYKQVIDISTTTLDSTNSVWVGTYIVNNEQVSIAMDFSEKNRLISEGIKFSELIEYHRKSNNDIYCYETTSGYGRYLPQEYDDESKEYITVAINGGIYKKINTAYPCYIFVNKNNKYKIGRKEADVYYECNEHGSFDDGFIRAQGDTSLYEKKHNWKFKLKKKVKLFSDWPSSKSYILKGMYNHDATFTPVATDMLYTIWREMTDERNTHQNPMEMMYFDGTSIVNGVFTNYIDMGLKYHETVAYLKENGTEEELKEYKNNKPSILNYVESEGKGATLTAPCLLFWENNPSENKPNKYECHGLYQLQIPINDKTVGFDADDDKYFCMWKSASFPKPVSGTNYTSDLYATTITESARSNNSYLREVNPIDNTSPIWSLNNIFFEEGEDYNKKEKIAAFNKMIDAVNDTTHEGQDWVEHIKKYIDINSLIDSMILNIYFGENDHNSKNRYYWTDDVTKIGNGSVWHTAIGAYRYLGSLSNCNNINMGNPFRLSRPSIGTTISKYNASTVIPCPDVTFRHVNSPNGIDQAFLRLWNDTDAVVKRFREIKHLLQWENTSSLFQKIASKYLLGSVSKCQDANGNDIIEYDIDGVGYYTKYIINPNTYMGQNEYKFLANSGNDMLVDAINDRFRNRMYVSSPAGLTSYYDLIKTFVYGTLGCTGASDAESKKAMYQKSYRGMLDYFYNRTEEMCDEQETVNGFSRPSVFSVIHRMLFKKDENGHSIKIIPNFNYTSDYVDVFSLLDYKKPHWVTRANLGGGELMVDGKYTPNQNNHKKYSNYKFDATPSSSPTTSVEIIGFENIKINSDYTCEKLVDGEYSDAKSDIDTIINGYIVFKDTANGTYKITCRLINNEYPMLSKYLSSSDEQKYNGLVKSNEVTIYVTDNDNI